MTPSWVARFEAKVDRSAGPDACWEWTASTNSHGYGQMMFADAQGRHLRTAHRLAYELDAGPIPDGMHVLHRCDNRPCCNPAHLFLGTNADNVADMVAKGRHSPGRSAGEDNYRSVLTESTVRELRARFAEGGITQRALAKEIGVSAATVSHAITGRNWRDVR